MPFQVQTAARRPPPARHVWPIDRALRVLAGSVIGALGQLLSAHLLAPLAGLLMVGVFIADRGADPFVPVTLSFLLPPLFLGAALSAWWSGWSRAPRWGEAGFIGVMFSCAHGLVIFAFSLWRSADPGAAALFGGAIAALAAPGWVIAGVAIAALSRGKGRLS